MHSSVSEFWLETMAKNKLQEKRSVSTVDVNISEHKDDLNACTAELDELEKRIWALQSTTLSANQEIKEKVNFVSDSEVAIREERMDIGKQILELFRYQTLSIQPMIKCSNFFLISSTLPWNCACTGIPPIDYGFLMHWIVNLICNVAFSMRRLLKLSSELCEEPLLFV